MIPDFKSCDHDGEGMSNLSIGLEKNLSLYSLSGGHISVTSSPISSTELKSIFLRHIPPPLIDEISDHLTKMSMTKVLISPIKR